MIKNILLSGFLVISTLGFGQKDFSSIDKNSKTVSDSLTDYKDVANYLTHDLETDTEKARAIYIWIAHNIEYDLTQMNSDKRYDSDYDIINEVLTNRKGVCQHYSELFLAMSKSVGLESYLISGYTRDAFGKIADLSHAWNGIKIDSNYYLIDVTWAAGYQLNGKYVHKFTDDYFLKSPQDFIKDHMPFDPIWQFIDNPISNNDFISKDFSKLKTNGTFAFNDSIQQYKKQEKLEQLVSSNRRIVANGLENNLIQEQYNENTFQIINLKYNLAIENLNAGINYYNLYVSHKNRQFRNPKLDDVSIKKLIDNASNGVYAANEMFYGLFSTNKELNNLITDARNRMPEIISEIDREKEFVDKYLKVWKPFRIFMFY